MLIDNKNNKTIRFYLFSSKKTKEQFKNHFVAHKIKYNNKNGHKQQEYSVEAGKSGKLITSSI